VSSHRKHEEEDGLDLFFTLSYGLPCSAGTAGFDGYFKRLNPAWKKSLCFSADELLRKPFIEFVHPEGRRRSAEEARNA
jgi:PAS domain-containing protein